MITNFVLKIFYYFALAVSYVIAQFGDVPDNSSITSGIASMKSYYMGLNAYLPLDTIVSIITFSLVFEGIYFVYKLIKWGYNKVPGIS